MTDTKVLSNDLDEIMKALEAGVKDFMKQTPIKHTFALSVSSIITA